MVFHDSEYMRGDDLAAHQHDELLQDDDAAFLGNYPTEAAEYPLSQDYLAEVPDDDLEDEEDEEELCDNCGEHLEDCVCDEEDPNLPSEDEYART